jgi:hypothetical protein
MKNKLLSPEEILEIVRIEDKLKNIRWYIPSTTSAEIEKDLKFYMERHRIPFLEETALYAIHPNDIERFNCTLKILDEVSSYAKDLFEICCNYKVKVMKLKRIFEQNISKKKL